MASEEDKEVGRKFRSLREAAGLSQAQVSARAAERGLRGFHPQTITKLERGERTLKFTEAVVLTDVMGSSVEALKDLGARKLSEAEEKLMYQRRRMREAHSEVQKAAGNFLSSRFRFEREAEACAASTHPLVRAVLDSESPMSLESALDAAYEKTQAFVGAHRDPLADHVAEVVQKKGQGDARTWFDEQMNLPQNRDD